MIKFVKANFFCICHKLHNVLEITFNDPFANRLISSINFAESKARINLVWKSMCYLVFENHLFSQHDANFQAVPLFGALEGFAHIATHLTTDHSKILDGWEEGQLCSERRENCEREYEKGGPLCPLQALSWAYQL